MTMISVASAEPGIFGAASPDRVPLSVVIPTLDEALQISEALAALGWADEVIVADGGSSDGTPRIAVAAGAKVLDLPGLTIGGQRNAAIAGARHEWILALDADERVTDALVAEIRDTLADPAFDAYRIRFRNFYLGRELRFGHWGHDWHVRLFRRRFMYSGNRVHERLQEPAATGSLRATLLHRPYRDFAHHVQKTVRYARWGAEDLHGRGRSAGAWELAVRPGWRFFREFFGYRAFMDGRVGLLLAGMSATAAFLKYAFLFSLGHGPRDT